MTEQEYARYLLAVDNSKSYDDNESFIRINDECEDNSWRQFVKQQSAQAID